MSKINRALYLFFMETNEKLNAKLAELELKFGSEVVVPWCNPGCQSCKGYCTPTEFTA